MRMTGCCGTGSQEGTKGEYETVRIEKATTHCAHCEEYEKRLKSKPVAVICCEGGCLRGEVARQAANLLCYSLAPEKTARVCLGGAFTKDTGQRNVVREASRVIALEGCFVNCSSRMMKGVVDGLAPEVIIADTLYDFDRKLFAIDEMPAAEISAHARAVAQKIAESF